MEVLRAYGRETFASLAIRTYRLYFIGISLSHIGTWMQTLAMGWLVFELTGSGTALGTFLALRFAPFLAFGAFAGIIVDRLDKRSLLITTQSAFGLLGLLVAVLVYTDAVEMWMLFGVALVSGLVDLLDRPTRQTFVHEMVGPENIRNAVGLGSISANAARAVGPLIGGLLIATIGIAACFLANAVSYLGVILILLFLHDRHIVPERSEDGDYHPLSGLRYAFSMPVIRHVLIAVTVIGTLSYEFQVSLPLLAKASFGGTASDYAALLSAMGAGSVVGGLFAASRKHVAFQEFSLYAFLFGSAMAVTAFLPSLTLAMVGMSIVGFFSIMLTAVGNTMIQLESAPNMRGRVMSLWMMAIFGSTVIGGPIIGFIGEHVGGHFALATGGIAAIATALVAGFRLLPFDALFQIPRLISIRREEAVTEEDVKV